MASRTRCSCSGWEEADLSLSTPASMPKVAGVRTGRIAMRWWVRCRRMMSSGRQRDRMIGWMCAPASVTSRRCRGHMGGCARPTRTAASQHPAPVQAEVWSRALENAGQAPWQPAQVKAAGQPQRSCSNPPPSPASSCRISHPGTASLQERLWHVLPPGSLRASAARRKHVTDQRAANKAWLHTA